MKSRPSRGFPMSKKSSIHYRELLKRNASTPRPRRGLDEQLALVGGYADALTRTARVWKWFAGGEFYARAATPTFH